MATDRTLVSLATRTTTTVSQPKVQPFESDSEGVEASIDLLDERALSLALSWENVNDGRARRPSLAVVLESSNDNLVWSPMGDRLERGNTQTLERGGVFGMVNLDAEPSGSRLAAVVSPGRYIRARWRITSRGEPEKGSCRFTVTARST